MFLKLHSYGFAFEHPAPGSLEPAHMDAAATLLAIASLKLLPAQLQILACKIEFEEVPYQSPTHTDFLKTDLQAQALQPRDDFHLMQHLRSMGVNSLGSTFETVWKKFETEVQAIVLKAPVFNAVYIVIIYIGLFRQRARIK